MPAGLSLDRRQGFWVMERFEDPGVRADVSTDDWPFLYMAARVYPTVVPLHGAWSCSP